MLGGILAVLLVGSLAGSVDRGVADGYPRYDRSFDGRSDGYGDYSCFRCYDGYGGYGGYGNYSYHSRNGYDGYGGAYGNRDAYGW